MRMKISLSILLIAAVSSLSAQTASSPGRRLLADKDLFEFIWVADPELSPDGIQVAFTRVNCDEKRTGYETSIWLAFMNGKQAPMRMTNGKHDAQPRWSPDGKYLVFIRGGEKDDAGNIRIVRYDEKVAPPVYGPLIAQLNAGLGVRPAALAPAQSAPNVPPPAPEPRAKGARRCPKRSGPA